MTLKIKYTQEIYSEETNFTFKLKINDDEKCLRTVEPNEPVPPVITRVFPLNASLICIYKNLYTILYHELIAKLVNSDILVVKSYF